MKAFAQFAHKLFYRLWLFRRRIGTALLALGTFAAATTLAMSQQNPNTDIGSQVAGSYHGGNLDSVSLANGNLSLHIPLISYPQRGKDLSLDLCIRYSNKGFIGFATHDDSGGLTYRWLWRGNGVEVVRGGVWGLRDDWQQVCLPNCPGGMVCNPTDVEMLNAVAPDGGSHLMGGLCSDTSAYGGSITCPPGASFGDAIALDASGIHYLSYACPATQSPNLGILVEANGVRHFQQARNQFA